MIRFSRRPKSHIETISEVSTSCSFGHRGERSAPISTRSQRRSGNPACQPRSPPIPANETLQPTAALSDADLIDAYTESVVAFEAAIKYKHRPEATSAAADADTYHAELMRRLARAESAPGVTIPTDI